MRSFIIRYLMRYFGQGLMMAGGSPIRLILSRLFGLLSLVIGVIALLISLIDCIDVAGGIIGVLGLVLGLISMLNIRYGRVFNLNALLGIILNLVAISIGFGLVNYFSKEEKDPTEEHEYRPVDRNR